MEYLEFAGLILIVLILYIVLIKCWMLIADYIGKKIGISKLVYTILNKFTGKDHIA